MSRLLLTSIAFAVLQVGGPRGATPAELGRGAVSTRLAPEFGVPWTSPAPAGARSDDVRLRSATPASPALPVGLRFTRVFAALPVPEPSRSAPVPLPSLLPDVRAPPIQS